MKIKIDILVEQLIDFNKELFPQPRNIVAADLINILKNISGRDEFNASVIWKLKQITKKYNKFKQTCKNASTNKIDWKQVQLKTASDDTMLVLSDDEETIDEEKVKFTLIFYSIYKQFVTVPPTFSVWTMYGP